MPSLRSRVARRGGQGVLAVALLSALAMPLAGRSQDLVGCQLTDDGQLQCVPGVSADPQSQIRAMRQEISTDLQLEGAVQQQINGLQQLVLAGQAAEGQLLTATVNADALAGLPPSAFHWYRLTPGSSRWVLITTASGPANGPTYLLQPVDVQAKVMVVVAVPTPSGGSQRQPSKAVGPVQPAQP
jgi:hypothetical protein